MKMQYLWIGLALLAAYYLYTKAQAQSIANQAAQNAAQGGTDIGDYVNEANDFLGDFGF